jgi:PDZ domain-containing secreted protein
MRFKFQVVCYGKHDSIIEFQKYHWDYLDEMMGYIKEKATQGDVVKIEVTRWNDKGERE